MKQSQRDADASRRPFLREHDHQREDGFLKSEIFEKGQKINVIELFSVLCCMG